MQCLCWRDGCFPPGALLNTGRWKAQALLLVCPTAPRYRDQHRWHLQERCTGSFTWQQVLSLDPLQRPHVCTCYNKASQPCWWRQRACPGAGGAAGSSLPGAVRRCRRRRAGQQLCQQGPGEQGCTSPAAHLALPAVSCAGGVGEEALKAGGVSGQTSLPWEPSQYTLLFM